VPQHRPGPTASGGGGEATAASAVGGPTVPHFGRRWGHPPASRRRGGRVRPLRQPPRDGRRRQRRRGRRGGGRVTPTAAAVAHHTAAAARGIRQTAPARRHHGGHNRRRPRRRAVVNNRGWDTNDFFPCGKARATGGDSAGRQKPHTLTWSSGGSCGLQFVSRPTAYQHIEAPHEQTARQYETANQRFVSKLIMANESSKLSFWRRAVLSTGPTWLESTLVMSPYCWEISPHATGRPQSTGLLHMPLWTDATAVPHGFLKRTSCPLGRPDSAQCSSSRRDASGGVKTSSPRKQEISSTKVCGKHLRV